VVVAGDEKSFVDPCLVNEEEKKINKEKKQ